MIVDLPTITEKDRIDIVDWGLPNKVDFIAASFVRKGSDVRNIREVLGEEGREIQIISKVENQEGLVNFDDILAASDAIMVARGDLGMEIPTEKIFLAQKLMIEKCKCSWKTSRHRDANVRIDGTKPTTDESGGYGCRECGFGWNRLRDVVW